MGDILTPSERRDAVVFVGVDRADNVELVKVYALSEDLARQTLEEFFNARGLFPADYVVVSRGWEPLGRRKAITTRTEEGLSSLLARFGLKLLSNGVLLPGDAKRIYQITLVTEELKDYFARRGDPLKVFMGLVEMGISVIVENLRGVELSELLPEDFILLREPTPSELVRALSTKRPIVVETVDASRYLPFEVPALVRLPPLTPEEFADELSKRVGAEIDPALFSNYPEERLNIRNARALADMVEAMVKRGVPLEKALVIAVQLNASGP